MRRKLINWLGLTGVAALISYTAAVIFAPSAYPGYDWMAQANSDLSAENAPSRRLWDQLAALYGPCSVVCATLVSVYVSGNRTSSAVFRLGIHLFAVMNWVSGVGYTMFPLADSGKEIASFQEVMHRGDSPRGTALDRIAGDPDHRRRKKKRSAQDRDLGRGRPDHDDDGRRRTEPGPRAVLRRHGTVQRFCRSRLQRRARDISVYRIRGGRS